MLKDGSTLRYGTIRSNFKPKIQYISTLQLTMFLIPPKKVIWYLKCDMFLFEST